MAARTQLSCPMPILITSHSTMLLSSPPSRPRLAIGCGVHSDAIGCVQSTDRPVSVCHNGASIHRASTQGCGFFTCSRAATIGQFRCQDVPYSIEYFGTSPIPSPHSIPAAFQATSVDRHMRRLSCKREFPWVGFTKYASAFHINREPVLRPD